MEKPKYSQYRPLSEDDLSKFSEQDGLIYEDRPSKLKQRSSSLMSPTLLLVGGLVVTVVYSFVLVALTSAWWKKQRLHGAAVVDTPLREFMHYEPTHLFVGEESTDYPLMGHPSEELDAAWADLMQDFYTEVPHSYIESVGRLDEAIPTENGGFLAIYSFMHQLHCLKRIHHSYWPERYFPNTTVEDKVKLQEHNLHCLQMLLTLVMCKADTNPETLHWVEENRFPLGNRDSPHECVNWDLLMNGMKKSRVDPFKPGVLIHPKFGPVVPDGRKTIINANEKHRFLINPTTIHNSEQDNRSYLKYKIEDSSATMSKRNQVSACNL